MAKSCFALLPGFLAVTGYLCAQETMDQQSTSYVPLTITQSYAYSMSQVFTLQRVFQVAAHAAFEEARMRSDGWGSGIEAFEIRSASSFGRAFVKENLAFGVRALDGEDPRYTRLGQGSLWTRMRYAMRHTFTAPSREGADMPAYSLLANYAMPFIAQEWYPRPIHTGRELGNGTVGVGCAVSTNLGREFWPDLKKRLRH